MAMGYHQNLFKIGKSQKGMTLVEVLVCLGIIATLAAVFAQYQLNQMKETKALNEKSATVDLEKVLISALADGSGCLHALNTPTALTFDSTAVTSSSPVDLVPTVPLYSKVVSGVPGPVVARVGDTASPAARSVVIQSIKLRITEGSGTNFKGAWIIDFDTSQMVRPLKPVMVSTILRVDNTNPAAATIIGCMNEGSSGVGPTRIVTQTYSAWRWPNGTATCDADEYLVSGGGQCSSAIGWMMIAASYPHGTNAWYVACDTQMHINATLTVYALCAKK